MYELSYDNSSNSNLNISKELRNFTLLIIAKNTQKQSLLLKRNNFQKTNWDVKYFKTQNSVLRENFCKCPRQVGNKLKF